MFVSNPECRMHVEGILFQLSFFQACCLCLSVVCVASLADPNTVQIDRMITAFKQLLLGLVSLAFMSLQPVHQCQYRPDGWGADSMRVSRFIFFLSIVPSYTPLKAFENHHLAWEETFDLTEADTISAEAREPFRWWRNSNNAVARFRHLCGDAFHNWVAKKGSEGSWSCNATNYNLPRSSNNCPGLIWTIL